MPCGTPLPDGLVITMRTLPGDAVSVFLLNFNAPPASALSERVWVVAAAVRPTATVTAQTTVATTSRAARCMDPPPVRRGPLFRRPRPRVPSRLLEREQERRALRPAVEGQRPRPAGAAGHALAVRLPQEAVLVQPWVPAEV